MWFRNISLQEEHKVVFARFINLNNGLFFYVFVCLLFFLVQIQLFRAKSHSIVFFYLINYSFRSCCVKYVF